MEITKNKIQIDSNIKYCPVCGAIVRGYKKYSADYISINVPVFTCSCFENRNSERQKEIDKELIYKLFKESNIEEQFLKGNYPVYNPRLLSYYNNIGLFRRGVNILIGGRAGNHKTGQTTALMKKAIKNKIVSIYYKAVEVIDIKEMSDLYQCDLLVLDNFGSTKYEAYGDKMFNLLDRRIHNLKSNIIITNGGFEDCKEIYNDSLIDRIDKMFDLIIIDGESKRKKEKIYDEIN